VPKIDTRDRPTSDPRSDVELGEPAKAVDTVPRASLRILLGRGDIVETGGGGAEVITMI
jgi:hypothetical protein